MTAYLRFVGYDEADINGDPLGEVTHASQKSILMQHNGVGAGEFNISRHSSQRQWCREGRYIRVWYTDTIDETIAGDPIFGFFVTESQNTVLSEAEQSAEVFHRSGEGPLSLLSDAIVWNEAVDAGDAASPNAEDDFWHWTAAMGAHAAGIMVRFLEEAVVRECWNYDTAGFLTWDFSRTLDSNGDAWTSATEIEDFQVPIGEDLLNVAGLLQQVGVVFTIDPDTFVLHAYEAVSFGMDLSASVTFARAVNINTGAEQRAIAAPARSTVLVKGTRGDNGETAWVPTDSPAGLSEVKRRKEGFLDANNTTGFDTLQRMGFESIYQKLRLKAGPTYLGVYDPALVPMTDYAPGDTVTVDVPNIWDEEAKVLTGVGIVDREAGDADVIGGFEAGPSYQSKAISNPGSPLRGDTGCCPPEGPFVPPPVDEDCGIAAQATLEIGSAAFMGTMSDVNGGAWSDTITPPELTNGLQYRIVYQVLDCLFTPINGYANMSGPTFDCDPDFDSILFGIGGSPNDPGTVFNGPWATFSGVTGTPWDAIVGATPSSGFYGFHYKVLGTLQVRNGDGSAIDCGGDSPGSPSEGQHTIEQALGTGTTRFTNYPYMPGSLQVWVGGVLVQVTETDPATGEFELPFDPGASRVIVHYQATGGASLGTGNPGPTPGVIDTIPEDVLPPGAADAPHIIYSRDYGVVADGSTDDTASRQAAIDAAEAAAIAGNGLAIVRHPWGIIQHAGSLVTTGNYYAQVTLPERAGSATKIAIIEEPENWEGNVLFPGGLQSSSVASPVIFRSSLTGGTYSGTHGWPSITGGPDPEKTANFSNLLYHVRGIVVRAPNNPSLCGFNLQLLNQAIVEDCYFDTADTITGGITQPTHATGAAVLMPQEGNNAICEYRGNIWAVGWYAGAGIGEHTRADTLTAYRCVVGLNVQGDYYHAANIDQLITEHCTYAIATVGIAGIGNPSGASGFAAFNIGTWTIEDATSGWAAPTAHINDPGNDYRGRARVVRVVAGTGNASPQTLTLSGATGYGIDYILDGAGGSSFATPAIVLGTAAAAGSASTVIRSDATIVAFDATAPTTSAIGDAAATGSQAKAARRDHVHGREALSTATPLIESGAGAVGTGIKSSREDHVHPAAASGGIGPLLLASDHGTPIVFDDILQASDGSDFLYASEP